MSKLTDEELERLANQTERELDELDEEVAFERAKIGRPLLGSEPATVMPVRVDPELRRAILERSKADEISQSEVVRRALRWYLRTPRVGAAKKAIAKKTTSATAAATAATKRAVKSAQKKAGQTTVKRSPARRTTKKAAS